MAQFVNIDGVLNRFVMFAEKALKLHALYAQHGKIILDKDLSITLILNSGK